MNWIRRIKFWLFKVTICKFRGHQIHEFQRDFPGKYSRPFAKYCTHCKTPMELK